MGHLPPLYHPSLLRHPATDPPDPCCTQVATLLAEFEQHGHATLLNAFPTAVLERLAPQLDADAARLRLDEPRMIADRGEGHSLHHQLGVPREAPWITRELMSNPLLEQIAATLLGPGTFLAFCNGNTCMPGSGRQGLHSDSQWCAQLPLALPLHAAGSITHNRCARRTWTTEADARAAGQPWPHRPTQLVFQFGPREIREEDGATEVYPGTHNDPRWAEGAPIPETESGRRATGHSPIRLTIPAGAVALREMRMWHQGVSRPNSRHSCPVQLSNTSGGLPAGRESLDAPAAHARPDLHRPLPPPNTRRPPGAAHTPRSLQLGSVDLRRLLP